MFIPITQTEMMKYLTKLPMRIMEQYETGRLVSIATTDIEKMDSVIEAMFMIITQAVDIVLQVPHHTAHSLHERTSLNPPDARPRPLSLNDRPRSCAAQLLVLALFSWRVLMFGSVCFVLVAISMDFYSSKFSKATADVQETILSFFKTSHVSSADACPIHR